MVLLVWFAKVGSLNSPDFQFVSKHQQYPWAPILLGHFACLADLFSVINSVTTHQLVADLATGGRALLGRHLHLASGCLQERAILSKCLRFVIAPRVQPQRCDIQALHGIQFQFALSCSCVRPAVYSFLVLLPFKKPTAAAYTHVAT